MALRWGVRPGARRDKGLVPATYVELLPFEAVCAADYSGPAQGHLRVRRGERVRVEPHKSTADCWWASLGAQAEGGAAVAAEGTEGRLGRYTT